MRNTALALIAVLSSACAREGASPPPKAVVAAAAPVGAGVADRLDEKLRHCPLTVPSVVVEVRDVDGGVDLDLRVASDDAMEELRRRVRHLEEFTRKRGVGTGERHGTGKGGGFMRECPIVTRDTIVTGAESDHRFVIAVRPSRAADAEALRSETRKRLEALAARDHDATPAH